MKKIISLCLCAVLVALMAFSLSACSGGDGTTSASDRLKEIVAMYEVTKPTQTVTTTTQNISEKDALTSISTLTFATVDGADAVLLELEYDELAALDGSTNSKYIRRKTEKSLFVDGKGLSVNGSSTYDPNKDIRPKSGGFAPTLLESKMKNLAYDEATHTLSCVVPAKNTYDIFGDFIASKDDNPIQSDLKMSITTSGGRISRLVLEYIAPAHEVSLGEEGDTTAEVVEIPASNVKIEVNYYYDAKDITY